MSIVVALFLGLTVSAEEIFKDRKILKREKFLNLSRSSYLMSKIIILTTISAIQAVLFVIIGNTILGIIGMYFEYWLVLFSVFELSLTRDFLKYKNNLLKTYFTIVVYIN